MRRVAIMTKGSELTFAENLVYQMKTHIRQRENIKL